jgi:NADPH:quinone reductase-like Zn-dependent oxidoreductase
MKAALVAEAGQAPVYGEFKDPVAAPGKRIIRVAAASISHLTRGRASGSHYSASGELPFIAGIDGAGVADDGRRYYFILPEKPFGAMAERCIVDEGHCIAIPDALSDDEAAAMAIPGMSSWAALKERAILLPGETVLINGATGASGRLAIQIAKHLGAKRVIATGRHTQSFGDLRLLGADATLQLMDDRTALAQAFEQEFRRGVDIVLDYIWGMSAETLIIAAAKAGAEAVPIRYVQIGSMSGPNINLPSAALRSSALQLMGSGMGSLGAPKLLTAIEGVLQAAPAAGFKTATTPMPLSDVAKAWAAGNAEARIVLHP